MKKFTSFLTACLAFLGVGTAWAQTESLPMVYEAGTQITTLTSGQNVLIQTAGNVRYNVGGYLNATAESESKVNFGASTTISENSIWQFIETGTNFTLTSGTEVPVYILKNTATGFYLQNNEVDSSTDDAEIPMTADESQAWKFTALHPTGFPDADNPRSSSAEGNAGQSYDENAFVLCSTTLSGERCIYLCQYLAYAIYQDTDQWGVYEAVAESDVKRVLSAALTEKLPNGTSDFIAGTDPGQYGAEEIAALTAAYDAAQALIADAGANPSYDECNAAYQNVVAALAALNASLVMPQDGQYYFIISNRNPRYAYAASSTYSGYNSGVPYMGVKLGSYTEPTLETVTAEDAKYLFKYVVLNEEAGTFALQNYYTGGYIKVLSVNETSFPLVEEPDPLLITAGTTAISGCFQIYSATLTGSLTYLNASNSNGVVRWSANDAGAYFKLVNGTSLVSAIEAEVAQLRVTEELSTLLSSVKEVYDKGIISTPYGDNLTLDDNFDDPGIISVLTTNAQEGTEGPIANATDGDKTTYFHSDWHGNVSDYHYLQAELTEAVSGIAIKIGRRHNNANHYLKKFRILVTNTPDDESSWEEVGDYYTNFNIATTDSLVTHTKSVYASVNGVNFGAPYQYVRVVCLQNSTNSADTQGAFFTLSEIRFYKGGATETPTAEMEVVDEAVRTELANQISIATVAVRTNTATAENIAALQAAYDAFAAQFADASVLQSAITAANAVATASLPIGEGLGEYPQAALDAFKAVIAAQQAIVDAGTALTVAQIQEGVAALEAAQAAFEASLTLPEAGKYYMLRGATTVESNARALNAPIYALTTTTTPSRASIFSMRQIEGQDQFPTVTDFLQQIWQVESAENGKIVLRNVGTGFYMGEQDQNLSGNVPLSATPVELGIKSANIAGVFNIIVGDSLGYYLNFGGQVERMVAWSSASGADNSAVTFEDVTDAVENNFSEYQKWYMPVTSGDAVILTLPVTIENYFVGQTAYDVLGISTENEGTDEEAQSIELAEFNGDYIPAGTPFLLTFTENPTFATYGEPKSTDDLTGEKNRSFIEVTLFTADGDAVTSVDDIDYATEVVESDNQVLVGTLAGTATKSDASQYTAEDLLPNDVVVFTSGKAAIIGANSTAANRILPDNAGYILNVATDEIGDVTIALSKGITTGINTVATETTAAQNAVYSISGVKVRSNGTTKNLPAGIYVVGGKKVIVK